jgi:hypothetical protein
MDAVFLTVFDLEQPGSRRRQYDREPTPAILRRPEENTFRRNRLKNLRTHEGLSARSIGKADDS